MVSMMSKTGAALYSILVLLVLGSAGCGSDPDPSADAATGGTPDGAAGSPDGAAGTPDGAGGNVRTGAAYEPCTLPSDCLSGNCRDFGTAGFTVCTQACDGANPCPAQPGAPEPPRCNGMGICRPSAVNTCTP